jgi:hypothetical protein
VTSCLVVAYADAALPRCFSPRGCLSWPALVAARHPDGTVGGRPDRRRSVYQNPDTDKPRGPSSFIPCGIYALSGVVRVAGVPTAGATVALLADRQIIASVVTDRSGAYGFPEVSNFSFSGALVGASMPGYFTDTKYILMTGPRQLDFDLIEAARIPFGQRVRSPVGDARCASLGYGGMGGAPCRRLVVTVPASGTLVVTLSATPSGPFDISILTALGAIVAYRASSVLPIELTASVETGLTYQVDVVAFSSSIREFELSTTLR